MALELDLQVATQHRPVPAVAEFQTWASAALEPGSNAVLTIRIVDAEESRQLNQAYRGKDKPTNVLSFTAELPPEVDIPLLGDVIICAPVVASEAASQGKPDTAHWAHLTIHGILHLLGMDHEEADDAQRMEHKEIEILASLGIANPYN